MKKFLINLAVSILQMVIRKLKILDSPVQATHNEMLYLAPNIQDEPPEGYTHYFEQLDYFLNSCSENVTEIALTGPYGSGKSTLLKTYFKTHSPLDAKFVSLGTYLPDKTIKSVDELEKAIARELLYQHSGLEEIGSRFKFPIYKKNSKISSYIQATIITLWMLLITYTIYPDKNHSLNWFNEGLYNANFFNLKTWLFCYLIAVPICLLSDIYRYISKNRLSSINPLDGNIEFSPDSQSGNSFSLHLEELLRFFIATKCDVVIIEDLDRYNNPEVFESLKELNSIVNKSDKILNPVRFVYAIRDDIFIGSNRTKFFDAIIPIIPVMSPFNSYERFKLLFSDQKLVEKLEPVLRRVSVSVPDMRVLRNIVNEFNSYRKILKTQNSDNNYQRLLSFIVYKNLYSHDFAKLYTNDISAIDNAVIIKENVRQERIKLLTKKLEKLIEEDKESANDLLQSEEEYYWSLVGSITNHLNVDAIIAINNTNVKEYTAEDILNIISKESGANVIYVWSNNRYNSIRANIHDLNIKNLNSESIEKRLGSIRGKNKEIANQRKIQISKLNSDILETSSITWPLSEAMNKNPKAEWVPNNMPVLEMLLREGWIDEHYGLYLNHVLEGKLTVRDFNFLRALRDRLDFDIMFRSSNYPEVLSYISDNDAYSPAAINHGLLEYLVNSSNHSVLLDKIVKIHFIESLSGAENLYNFRQVSPDWHKLIWPNIILDISSSIKQISTEHSLELLIDLAYHSKALNNKEYDYINNIISENILTLNAINKMSYSMHVIIALSRHNLSLKKLDDSIHLRGLVITCVENNIVELNEETLVPVVNAYHDRYLSLPISYELINSHKELSEFLDRDFYSKVRLSISKSIIDLDVEFIIEILNSTLNTNMIESAIKEINFTLESLVGIPINYWVDIVDSNKFKVNWLSVTSIINDYLNDNVIDSKWICSFFCKEETMAALNIDLSNIDIETKNNFISFVEQAEIKDDCFIYYIDMFNLHYTDDKLVGLSINKISSLILNHKLEPSLKLYDSFKDENIELSYLLVEVNPYLINEEGFTINEDDFYNLLHKLHGEHFRDLVEGWDIYLNTSTSFIKWLPVLSQNLKVNDVLIGLVKNGSGYNIPRLLKEVGVREVTRLSEEQVINAIKSNFLTLEQKLNFLIGQVPFHKDKIVMLVEESLGSEWSLLSKKHLYSDTVYVLLLTCLNEELFSSLTISSDNIKVNHFRNS